MTRGGEVGPRPRVASRWWSQAAACCITLWGMGASAAPVPVALDYQATAGCPDAEGFLAQVQRRLPRSTVVAEQSSTRRVRVRARDDASSAEGDIVLSDTDVARHVAAQTCEAVIEGLALILAVSLDAPEQVPVKPPRITESPRPPRSGEDDKRGRFAETFASWQAVGGPAPAVLMGGELVARMGYWGRDSFSLGVSLGHSQTGEVTAGSGLAAFKLSTLGVHGCAPVAGPGAWRALGCLVFRGGVLGARGVSSDRVTDPRSVQRAWAETSLELRCQGVVVGSMLWTAEGGVVASATHRSFVFDNPREVVHDPSRLGWRLGAGAGWAVW